MAPSGGKDGRAGAAVGLIVLLWVLTAIPVALAQEAPSPSPDPSVSVEPSPSASPSPSDTPTPTPTSTATPASTGSAPGIGAGAPTLSLGRPRVTGHPNGDGRRARRRSDRDRWAAWRPSTAGAWSTRRLDRAAARARARGWSAEAIALRIYAPFPVIGPASWSDSWGAPRFAGGYHPHEGQDVLCRWGAPVLAVEDARVTYGWNRLGGKVAYLQRPDGSFWYHAHLSRTRPGLDGNAVARGTIIGRRGATGDATAPHVHLGFYTADRVALDPMHALTAMLRTAEDTLRRRPNHRVDVPVATPQPPPARTTSHPTAAIGPPTEGATIASAPDAATPNVVLALGLLSPLALCSRRVRRGIRAAATAAFLRA